MPINCSTYFFEESKRGYSQYPHDYAEDIFKSYRELFDTDAQIVAHRRPNLMSYTYMKKLSDSGCEAFFGISVVINGLETKSIKSLFKLFEKIFQQIVSEGEILTINSEGAIVSKGIVFSSYATSFNRFSSLIKNYIDEGESFFSPMLPVVYSASEDDYAIISINEKEGVFRQNLSIYNKLFITKNYNTTSAELNGLAVKIENLSQQVEYLKQRNAELENKCKGQSNLGWKALAISSLTIIIVLALIFIYCVACGLISFNL